MAVTIDSVRTRWGVPTSISDDLLTLLLAEAVTQIQGQVASYSVHYDMALTALAAHNAFERAQTVATVNGVGGVPQSQGFVERSESRGSESSYSASVASLPYMATTPGRVFFALVTQRGRAISRGVT